jgi:hypothetical protein
VGQRLAAADLGVENVNGLGRLLSQQLVMAGEQVVDVPASLSHRTRKLSGKSGRKTDEHDARSVAIAAAHPGRLRQVELEDFTEALGLTWTGDGTWSPSATAPSAGFTHCSRS